ncbi:MAG: hypothetical protein DRH37_06575 [Deltaproteobacteria bacterium]|nr:MAG: hypothetical protein DRH37_06575 [Deltaproteobacteria bacterium]
MSLAVIFPDRKGMLFPGVQKFSEYPSVSEKARKIPITPRTSRTNPGKRLKGRPSFQNPPKNILAGASCLWYGLNNT